MIQHLNQQAQPPERVILLGAHGFIAAAIRAHLEVHGVQHLAFGSDQIDLTDSASADKLASALKPSDAVVMLAAITPDKGRDVTALMKNLAMMQTVCAAIEKTGCTQLIYFSSDAVYAPDVSRVSEEIPASPRDLYGAMHYTRELMASGLAETPVLILRPTLVYGVKDSHNSYGPNRFRRAARKDDKISLFGDGEETRDHIHVDDVALLTVRCLLRRSTGVLNVATGTSLSFYETARIVAKQFESPVEITTTPRANPVTHRHYDVINLIKAFPDFRFIPLAEGAAQVHKEMLETADG